MGLTEFQGGVVDALNNQDARNQDLLDQVITAADEISNNESDVAMGDAGNGVRDAGEIQWGGHDASIQGTGGIALLEYAKDAIQTAVSNISGVGTNQIQARKLVERKMSQA